MIASLLAFVGCQNEELVNENNTDNSGKKVILTANIQGAADSRVALTPDTENGAPIVKVAWNESGETFEVYGSSGDYSTFTQIAGTNQFEGTLPESATGEYEAYYGDPNSLDEQDGKLGQSTANDSPVLMSAMFNSSSPSITFEHVTAILKPTFKVNGEAINNTITKIVMGGVAKNNLDNGYYLDEITIPPTSPTTAMDDDIYIHLLVFPQVYIDGHEFSFTVTADGKNYTGSLTIPTGMSIEAGKLYTATIELTEVLSAEYIWKSDITASESVEGEGTEASPYLIHSANDLQWMIDQVNTNGVTGKYYRLTHDLEIDSEEEATWTPIGTADDPFVGNFDGGGYTISGEMHTTTDLVGFFGYNAGAISNLKNAAEVKDCRTLMPASIEYSAIGSIAGYSKGKIINCENSGNVTAPSFFTTTYTGGICGYQYGEREDVCAFIMECKNSGAVTGVDGDGNATGGIVGQSSSGYNPVVCASENTGSVTNGQYLGGICGYTNETLMVACRNLGEVEQADGAYSGGIVGYAYTEYGGMGISGCFTTIGYVSGGTAQDIEDGSYCLYEGYLNDPEFLEWLDDIIGPWDNPEYQDADGEMNYAIVQYNFWFSYNGCVCNWHWEVGENNIPKLVEGAPLGRPGA